MAEPKKRLRKLIEQNSFFGWLYFNGIKGEGGQLLEFANHAFLIDIALDWAREQVARKSSQVGFSTLEILKTFWAAKYKGYSTIYTLPTFADVLQFVPPKVNAIIGHNPILLGWTKDKNTTLQKKIGNKFVYYRGTFQNQKKEEKGEGGVGIMLSADILAMDEIDRSDPSGIEQYESRLDASDYAGKWYFSNPTHPKTISQKKWEQSDQKHWFVKCSHCGEWQYLSWPDSVRNGKFVCKKCGGEITNKDRRNGEWIKRFKGRDISGYWISHLICPWKQAKEIEEKAKNKTKDYFYNFTLGLPYSGTQKPIDKDLILQCFDSSFNPKESGNAMGIDVGLIKHYVIGNKQGIFRIGTAKDWDEIEFLIKRYDIASVVIDALPDLTAPRKLQKRYPSVIWLNFFKQDVKRAEFIVWDAKTGTVYSDRSKLLAMVIDELAEKKFKFQVSQSILEKYAEHWDTVYRKKVEGRFGEEEIWDTEGENHFVFATLYFRLAMERVGGGGLDIFNEKS